ncbi:MAG: ribulose phosphate epimerase [Myxococcota bacterium]
MNLPLVLRSSLALALLGGCSAKDDAAADSAASADGADDGGGSDDGSPFTAGNDDAPGDDAPGDDAPGDDAPADDAPADDGPADTGGFVTPPDGGIAGQCDPTTQDCPRGEKCSAYSTIEGDPWNANKCVAQTGDGQVGDPCDIVGGKYTGEDNCDVGLICLLTDDDGFDGACVEFCDSGMACSAGSCSVYNDGSLPICLTSCDPLIQDCPDGQGCYASSGSGEFICFKYSGENGEGVAGDPCNFINQCQPGTACLGPEAVEGCVAEAGCCSSYCDLADAMPNADCNGSEVCEVFFEDPAPDYADVGVCAIPV